jgi:hypothetical protein
MSDTTKWILSIILALVVAASAAGAALAAGNTPAGYTAQEWRAEVLRSQGMDARYGLGTRRTWLEALRIRSEALDRKYHLGRYAVASVAQSTPGFRWGDAGIGAAGALGALLIAAACVSGARRYRGAH